MRERFTTEPQKVSIITDGNTVYCQIALNAEEIDVPDIESETTHTEWECDFNSFHCSRFDIDIEDVRLNPEMYIDFKPESVSDAEQRLRDIENALAELGDIIGG